MGLLENSGAVANPPRGSGAFAGGGQTDLLKNQGECLTRQVA